MGGATLGRDQVGAADAHRPAPFIPLPVQQVDETFARQILEQAPTIIYVYDVKEERSVFQNRGLGEMLGYPDEPAHAQSEWRRFIHADDAAQFPAYRERLKNIKPGEILDWHYRMRNAAGEWRWLLSHDTLLASDADGTARYIVGGTSDITGQKRAEDHKAFLAREAKHRAKNLLATIEAIGQQTRPKGDPAFDEFWKGFMGRINVVLGLGDRVMTSGDSKLDLRDAAEQTLAPFSEAGSSRIRIEGPSLKLNENTVAIMSLAFHELATNALKYGALKAGQGEVLLSWRATPSDAGHDFLMEWKERGGPAVIVPERSGFGTRVLQHAAAREKNGQVHMAYEPDGVYCRISFEVDL